MCRSGTCRASGVHRARGHCNGFLCGWVFSLYKHRFLRQEETAWVRHSSNQHDKETFLLTDLPFIKPESFNRWFCFFLKGLSNTCSSFLGKSLKVLRENQDCTQEGAGAPLCPGCARQAAPAAAASGSVGTAAAWRPRALGLAWRLHTAAPPPHGPAGPGLSLLPCCLSARCPCRPPLPLHSEPQHTSAFYFIGSWEQSTKNTKLILVCLYHSQLILGFNLSNNVIY